jgi:hypothetical protein
MQNEGRILGFQDPPGFLTAPSTPKRWDSHRLLFQPVTSTFAVFSIVIVIYRRYRWYGQGVDDAGGGSAVVAGGAAECEELDAVAGVSCGEGEPEGGEVQEGGGGGVVA